MTKPITGQYECIHSSGVGLDYFTSRIDRLVLQPNERFILTIQNRSRLANAAQSLASGQQVSAAAPEIRREGRYNSQNNSLELFFDDGGFEPGQIAVNGDGVQLGPNFFNKVSDSTLLPPTHRLQKDMDDIAKGLKIASTLGGMAVKAVKTIQGTIQTVQTPQTPGQGPTSGAGQPPASSQSAQPAPYVSPAPATAQPPTQGNAPQPPQGYTETIFCDQCGARSRPGKRFCNNCGARLV